MKYSTIISKIFNNKTKWWGTPEQFLGLIIYFQYKNAQQYSKAEISTWATIMMEAIHVNFSPYKNFDDLFDRAEPDFSIVIKTEAYLEERKKRIELKKAIYGDNVDLGDDNIFDGSESSIIAQKIVDKIEPFIQFRDEKDED